MNDELKQLLETAYTSSLKAIEERRQYLYLPLDERTKLMEMYIEEMRQNQKKG